MRKVDAVDSTTPDERKVVTIVFADLVGSTALGDEEDPERTRQLLERFYVAMSEELGLAGGTVEKFAGDAVMAVFGSPVAQEDHAERALHAALAMRTRLASEFSDELALRIGVNSGEVVVGAAHAGSSFVSGDAVNVAARLEQSAQPGQVLVGTRTAAAVRGAFELGPVFPLEVKGKRAAVEAHELRRAIGRTRPRWLGPFGSAFVGREKELEQIRAAWHLLAAQGESHLLVVVGDAGIGKTTLTREALSWLAGQSPAPVVRSGRCVAYGQGSTYSPLAEVLRKQMGIPQSASSEEVLAQLRGREILGLTFGLDVANDLHPLAARERFHDAWIVLLEEMTMETPAVVVIEDLHWAEPPLLDLLEDVTREVRAPLLLLATARPEYADARSAPSLRGHVTTVWLEPLSSADAGAMVVQLLGGDVPTELDRLVTERAEGNPFFVEELVASLIDRALLREADDGWELAEIEGVAVPDSVRAVIAARMDLLDAVEKAALQAASIAGRTFASTSVVELLDGAEPDFRVLETRGFVSRSSHASAEGREYSFKHALIREVAYASLPKARRAHLHARYAERLERLGESGDQFASLLAHHYFEAVRPEDADLAWSDEPTTLALLSEKAIAWLQRAGELALGLFAIDNGLALLERALTLDPDPEIEARIWQSIGRAHGLRYEGGPTIDAYRRALEFADDAETRAEIYSSLALETVTRWGMLNPMPTAEVVDDLIDSALSSAAPRTAQRARALIARALWLEAPEAVAREAVEIAEATGDVELVSHAYNARALTAFLSRRYDESYTWALRRIALVDEISDPDHLVDIYSMPIPGLLGLGRFDEARTYAEMHDAAASKLSPHHQLHGVAFKLELEEIACNWNAISDLTPRTVHAVDANRATPCIRNARSMLSCAVASAVAGADGESINLEERANEIELEGFAHMLAPVRMRLALQRDELEAVERLLMLAVPIPPAKNWWLLTRHAVRLDALAALRDRSAVEREAPQLLVTNTYLEPYALRALGIVRDDGDLLAQAARQFSRLGLDWELHRTPTP